MASRVVTLLTDFGSRDGYVAAMKGVLVRYAPELVILDAGHGIPPQNLFAASWALCQYAWFYPEGTIHVVVVDPGVGTGRLALLVEADGRYFIGPDNGVLAMAVSRAAHPRYGALKPEVHLPDRVSRTFHGRDIFSYAAGLLGGGSHAFEDLADPVDTIVALPFPPIEANSIAIRGSVIHIDVFGNLITNIRDREIEQLAARPSTIEIPGCTTIHKWVNTYAEAGEGELAALINSSGHVEIACNGASAAQKIRAPLGSVVKLNV